MGLLRTLLTRLALGIASLVLATGVIAAEFSLDALDLTSIKSQRSNRALMTSVAKAGKRLVAVGERGIVLLSDDDGKTWRQAESVPISVTLTRVFFVDEKTSWAVGHSGVVLTSSDGGEHWTRKFDGKRAAELELEAARSAHGQGDRMATAERLLHEGADKPFLGAYFFDAKRGLVAGAYGLLFATDDGGQNWRSAMDRLSNPKGHHLYAIQANGQDVYIAGEQGALYHSGDGGHHFDELPTPSKGTYFGIVTLGHAQFIAFGLRGSAYRTADGGKSWEKIDLPPVTITTGHRLADGSVVLANEAGQVFRSLDGGKSFFPVDQRQPVPVVDFVQANNGEIILAGVRNLTRLNLETSPEDKKK